MLDGRSGILGCVCTSGEEVARCSDRLFSCTWNGEVLNLGISGSDFESRAKDNTFCSVLIEGSPKMISRPSFCISSSSWFFSSPSSMSKTLSTSLCEFYLNYFSGELLSRLFLNNLNSLPIGPTPLFSINSSLFPFLNLSEELPEERFEEGKILLILLDR